MTAEHLHRLQELHAFDPAPRPYDLHVLHVRFDDLTGSLSTEARLAAAVRTPERIAVVGPSGCGKSSAISSVLDPMQEDVAPIPIAVAIEDDTILTSPVKFAAHVVRTIANYVTDATLLSEGERVELLKEAGPIERPGGGSLRRIGIAPSWMGARVELATELATTAAPLQAERSAAEVIDQAARLVDLIGSHGLMPVLVIDQSDSWQSVEGMPDRTPLIAGFFTRVVRMLAEDLNSALVVAVHEDYLAMDAYIAATGFLETSISIPALPNADALSAILEHRVRLHLGSGHVVFGEGASAKLFDYYERGPRRSLRRVILVVHEALQVACAGAADQISSRHIETAIAELQGA